MIGALYDSDDSDELPNADIMQLPTNSICVANKPDMDQTRACVQVAQLPVVM